MYHLSAAEHLRRGWSFAEKPVVTHRKYSVPIARNVEFQQDSAKPSGVLKNTMVCKKDSL
jgi:hypothetical protein